MNAWLYGFRRKKFFHAYVFLKEVLKYCENKPEVVVDRGFRIYGFEKVRIEIRNIKPLVGEMLLKCSFSDLRKNEEILE